MLAEGFFDDLTVGLAAPRVGIRFPHFSAAAKTPTHALLRMPDGNHRTVKLCEKTVPHPATRRGSCRRSLARPRPAVEGEGHPRVSPLENRQWAGGFVERCPRLWPVDDRRTPRGYRFRLQAQGHMSVAWLPDRSGSARGPLPRCASWAQGRKSEGRSQA